MDEAGDCIARSDRSRILINSKAAGMARNNR
jgi:hypothetical protein